MNNEEHVLMVVVGKTGSGKSSLINKLCERRGYKQLISQTTRPKRSETDVDHLFVTEEDYQLAKESGEIVAETEINGYHYYATRDQVYEADIYTLDPIGRESLLSMNLPNLKIVTVYISCPDELRMDRAVNKRGDNKQTFRARNLSESAQFRRFVAAEQWDYSIKNISFARSYAVFRWICDIEQLWTNRKDGDE